MPEHSHTFPQIFSTLLPVIDNLIRFVQHFLQIISICGMKKFDENGQPTCRRVRGKIARNCSVLALEQFSAQLIQLQIKNGNKFRRLKEKERQLRLEKLSMCIKMAGLIMKESTPLAPLPPPIVQTPVYYYQPQSYLPLAIQPLLPQISRNRQSLYKAAQTQTSRRSQIRRSLNDYNQSAEKEKQINHVRMRSMGYNRGQARKGNRFRICGLAVYFCFVFPKFSRRFGQIRYKWFKERYGSPACLNQHAYAIHNKLEQIDWNKLYKASQVPPSNISSYPITNFLALLLTSLSQKLTNPLTQKSHNELFSTGLLNKHFLLAYQQDYMYYPQELQLLRTRAGQGGGPDVLVMDEETQVVGLLVRVMLKVVVYGFMMGVVESGQGEAGEMVGVAAVFLHSVCVEMYQIGLAQFRSKYKPMQTTTQALKPPTSSTRTINLLTTDSLFPQTHLQIPCPSPSLPGHPFPYIESMPGYSDLLAKVNQSKVLRQFRQEAADRMLDLVITIRQYLYREERGLYRFIWDLVLQEGCRAEGLVTMRSSSGMGNGGLRSRRKITHRRYQSQNDEQIRRQTQQSSRADRPELTQRTSLKQKSILKIPQSYKTLRNDLKVVKTPLHSQKTVTSSYELSSLKSGR